MANEMRGKVNRVGLGAADWRRSRSISSYRGRESRPEKLAEFRESQSKRFYSWALGHIRKTVAGDDRILKLKLPTDYSQGSNIIDRRPLLTCNGVQRSRVDSALRVSDPTVWYSVAPEDPSVSGCIGARMERTCVQFNPAFMSLGLALPSDSRQV